MLEQPYSSCFSFFSFFFTFFITLHICGGQIFELKPCQSIELPRPQQKINVFLNNVYEMPCHVIHFVVGVIQQT